MKKRRQLATVLLLTTTFAGVAASMPAWAQPRFCHDLHARLASLGRGRPNPVLVERYDRAIAVQLQQLGVARSSASRDGCAGLLSFFDASKATACRGSDAMIAHMESNLETLRRRRAILAGPRSNADEREKMLAALRANHCSWEDETVAATRPGNPATAIAEEVSAQPSQIGQVTGELDEQLPGGIVVHRSSTSGPDSDETGENATPVPNVPPGTYSTLCVRTCDGFYFPISYATSPSNFAADERICQMRCPGAETQLYYHREGEESEDMVSLSGVPYRKLPTAFLYRRTDVTQPHSCGCGTANYSAIGQWDGYPASLESDKKAQQPSIIVVGAPPKQETPVAAPKAPQLVTPPADANRKVRVVGPRFFPDPSKAIDLQAPAPTNAP